MAAGVLATQGAEITRSPRVKGFKLNFTFLYFSGIKDINLNIYLQKNHINNKCIDN